MPYIKDYERDIFEKGLEELKGFTVSPGQLNYLFTKLADDYINNMGKGYQTINDAIGALECAKLELYRRVVIPYEARKCEENGDVYTNGGK
jgi:hypothetical protein